MNFLHFIYGKENRPVVQPNFPTFVNKRHSIIDTVHLPKQVTIIMNDSLQIEYYLDTFLILSKQKNKKIRIEMLYAKSSYFFVYLRLCFNLLCLNNNYYAQKLHLLQNYAARLNSCSADTSASISRRISNLVRRRLLSSSSSRFFFSNLAISRELTTVPTVPSREKIKRNKLQRHGFKSKHELPTIQSPCALSKASF